MVKSFSFMLILATLLAPLPLFSNDAGSASYRGTDYFIKGQYSKSRQFFIRALHASRKEANLVKENKILLNLVALDIHSLNFDRADSIINQIELTGNADVKDYFNLISIQLAHGLGTCLSSPVALLINNNKNEEETVIIARSHLQLAECYIESSQFNEASTLIERATEVLDESGQLLFVKGQLAFKRGNSTNALSHLVNSLEKSQQKQRFFRTAILLYHLGMVNQSMGKKEISKKYLVRSLQVFEKLKLNRWYEILDRKIKEI